MYTGQFTDDLNYLDYSLEQGNAVRNRNSFIIPSNSHPLRMLEFINVQNLNELKYFQSGEHLSFMICQHRTKSII